MLDLIEKLPLTSGFTQAGVYARRQFCGNLEVYRPPEPLWNPRLREAATTLGASAGDTADGERLKAKSGNNYREVVTRKLAVLNPFAKAENL